MWQVLEGWREREMIGSGQGVLERVNLLHTGMWVSNLFDFFGQWEVLQVVIHPKANEKMGWVLWFSVYGSCRHPEMKVKKRNVFFQKKRKKLRKMLCRKCFSK